jgi:hypothetical protein
MKRLIGLAILAMCTAVPAHSQASHGGATAGSGGATNGGAGGWGGGGGIGGGVSGAKLASVAPARFNMTSASGSQDYVPSTFLSFDKAVVAGETLVETPAPTVAEAAREQMNVHLEKAKIALVQDDSGRAIILRQ